MSTDIPSPVVLDGEYFQDRHALHERLREQRPVCQAVLPDGLRVWLVTRYADAREALASPLLSKDSRRAAPLHDQQEQEGVQRTFLAEVLQSHMLNLDPPEHTRLRKLLSGEFTLRRVELLRPWVEQVVDGLLDRMAGRDRVDLLTDFAFPLTVTVIGELFGVPAADRDRFRELSNGIAFATSPEAAGQASAELAGYLAGLVERKRTGDDTDLLADLARGGELDEVELVSMAFLMLTAGYESTGHLIGNGVVNLLADPGQLAAVRRDPGLLPSVVEELLRFDGTAATTTLRFTTAPLRLGDVEIPAGEFVLVLLGSVNRDPGQFPEPDRLDVNRKPNRHLAFGYGVHHCLGAPLARLEGQVALGRLLTRFPDLALAVAPEELRWRENLLFRGLESVPLRPSPGEREE